MLKRMFFIACVVMAVGGCSPTQPQVQLTKQLQESPQTSYEQTFYRESPEIDLCKRMIDATLNGNWDEYPGFYADKARIWRNKAEMTPQQLTAYLQNTHESFSEYSMDPQFWEMVVTPEGDRWVHFWTHWLGRLEATGKMYDIPIHISMKVVNNKIVRQSEFFNEAEIAMDMLALAEEAYDGSTLTQPRVQLTSKQLQESHTLPVLGMSYFAKPKWAQKATNRFSGSITFVDTEITVPPSFSDSGWDGNKQKLFPSFSVDFVSDGDVLIPRNKGIISTWKNSESFWDIIVGVGKVWKETGDNGWDRASFPLTLVSRRVGQAVNCVGTFVYNQNKISNIYLQCSQETSPPDYPSGNIRVMLSAAYQPKPFDDSEKTIQQHYKAIESRLPTYPLQNVDNKSKLAHLFDKAVVSKASTSLGALVIDGNIYLHLPKTRHGNYPYPYEMRHGVFSVTKTMVGALSMFYLAQRYGEKIFNERITDYVPLLANQPGWQGVTFSHAFNMVTGTRGEDAWELLAPFVWTSTADEGIKAIINLGDSPEAPGEKFNYASTNTFVLSYAMQKYVEKKEGKGIYYWDLVRENVLKTINAQYLAVQHTEENDGSKGIPIIGWGAFPTVDETAKIAILLLNEGKYKGRQLLHKEKIREALSRTEWTGYENFISWSRNGVPGSYNHSFWSHNVITDKCLVKISYMAGHGANYVAFFPSNVILIRFMDEMDRDFDPLVLAVEEIRTSCK